MGKPSLLIALWLLGVPAMGQPAPQRSADLCESLQQSATAHGLSFTTPRPGACRTEIDKGYSFGVNYMDKTLYLNLFVDPAVLSFDANAYWLRLSAFDGLAHSALGIRQELTFDKLNTMSKQLAEAIVAAQGQPGKVFSDKVDKVSLLARVSSERVVVLTASATVGDIDRMRQRRESNVGTASRWRSILALSLQAFAAGAQGYTSAAREARQNEPPLQTIHTCYTNFLGASALTTCN
jgi:hypothetical protein